MSDATFAAITNKAAIAVNKDPLAEQGVLRISSEWLPKSKHGGGEPSGYMIWSGALSKGGVVAALLNLNTAPQEVSKSDEFVLQTRNCASKTRNFVLKTRNYVSKMMIFVLRVVTFVLK